MLLDSHIGDARRRDRGALCRGALALACLAAWLLAAGCGSAKRPESARLLRPAFVLPANSLESQVLAKMSENASGSKMRIDGVDVELGAPYHSASGALCRTVVFRGQPTVAKLACLSGEKWFFAPPVLGAQGFPGAA